MSSTCRASRVDDRVSGALDGGANNLRHALHLSDFKQVKEQNGAVGPGRKLDRHGVRRHRVRRTSF